jgi:hypothetical protein
VPAATSVTVVPVTVQTPVVVDEKATVRPELALALPLMSTGGSLNVLSASDENEIDWSSFSAIAPSNG